MNRYNKDDMELLADQIFEVKDGIVSERKGGVIMERKDGE